MRNNDANQAMMMGAGAAVTMTSCANNAVGSSLDAAAIICNESSSGFGVFFGLLTFVVGPLAGYISWKLGLHAELVAIPALIAILVWACLWAKFFTTDERSADTSASAFEVE